MPSPYHPWLALSACSLVSLTYVLGLYALVPPRIRALDRNDPVQIKARTLSAASSSAVAVAVTVSSVYYQQGSLADVPRLMGVHAGSVVQAIAWPLGSFVVLFTGPLAQVFLLDEASYNWFPEDHWVNARNLLVAPLTEELVFRSCIGTMMAVVGGFSWPSVVFGAPLFFGLAHVHHGVASVMRGESARAAAFTAAFQTVYTSLFGALEMHVFLRTGHLVSAVVVHSFCNLMGLPRLDLVFAQPRSRKRVLVACAAYVAGVSAFVFGAFARATDPLVFKGALLERVK